MSITHVLSATTPDDPGYEIQPQHWNSAHAQVITLVGNTAGASTISGTNIVFSAGPNVTMSVNGGSLVWSGGAGAAGNTGYLSAGTTYASLGTVSFSDLNGLSFGVDGQTITASHNALTTAMASNRGSDFVQAAAVFHGTSASGTIASGALSISIGPYITTGALSNHSHGASAANGSFGFQTLSFSNANGVSFGTSAGSAITASHNAITTGALSNHSHGDPQLNLTNLSGTTASNSAGLTISLSAAATVPETPFGVSAGTQSVSTGTLVFSNSNNVTFGMSGSSRVTASASFPSETPFGVSAGTQSVSTGTLVFSNSNGITFGMSGSSRVTASHDGLTSQSNQNVTAGNGGFAFQTLSFSNVNGFSFGTSAGSAITGSYTVPTQSNQQITMFATGNTTLSSTGTTNASSMIFRGSGAASVGITNGSILIDVAAGAAAITQSIGMSTQTAGGATGGTTGYATGDDILYHFVPGSNITMSQSINGASGTLSIYGPAAGGGITMSAWNPYDPAGVWMVTAQAQGSLWIVPKDVVQPFQYDRICMPLHFSQATNSTLTVSNTVAWGWYTVNGNTLSLYKSGSGTFSINGSGTASSGENSGIRVVSMGSTDTITAGNYYLGVVWRSTTAGANASLSALALTQFASTKSGYLGLASNTRMIIGPGGGGVWTSTTAGPVPNSVGRSDIRGNSSNFMRQPIVYFTSGQITY